MSVYEYYLVVAIAFTFPANVLIRLGQFFKFVFKEYSRFLIKGVVCLSSVRGKKKGVIFKGKSDWTINKCLYSAKITMLMNERKQTKKNKRRERERAAKNGFIIFFNFKDVSE